jgi:hypothetical protein
MVDLIGQAPSFGVLVAAGGVASSSSEVLRAGRQPRGRP